MSSLSAGVLAALLALPTYVEDRAPELAESKRAQLTSIAAAVTAEAMQQRVAAAPDWAALLLTIGWHETGFSLRIHQGECKRWECDGGKARGPWQNHAYGDAATHWERMHGLEHVALQTRVASNTLLRGHYTCRGKARSWFAGVVNGFAGRDCSNSWPGLAARESTWQRLRVAIRRAARRGT